MMGIQAERDPLLQSGYEAPVRKSLIDPERFLGCPKYAMLTWLFICGFLFLRWLPGPWYIRALLAVTCFAVGMGGMLWLTKVEPQWLEVGMESAQRSGRLEV